MEDYAMEFLDSVRRNHMFLPERIFLLLKEGEYVMNSIQHIQNTAVVPSASHSSPFEGEIREAEEKDAPLAAKLFAAIIPVLGIFMSELLYRRSPKRRKQILKISLWSLLIQSLLLIGGVIVIIWVIMADFSGHVYC